jgi:hypothetical protein
MTDPVFTPDGHSYERSAIVPWLLQHRVSPLTRQTLTVDQLTTNYALKEMIEEWARLNVATVADATMTQTPSVVVDAAGLRVMEAEPAVEFPLTTDIVDAAGPLLRISAATMQDQTTRRPARFVLAIDVSGSMSEDASIVSANGRERDGLTRLDLVKHSIRTIIASLSAHDELCIVTFNNRAERKLPMTKMTAANKADAIERVRQLRADGGTNLWEGIRESVCAFSRGGSENNYNDYILVLTDGASNDDPPRGIVPTLNSFLSSDASSFTGTIHTFGFSNQVQSKLLFNISQLGHGLFAFIPDGSMIGTIFVNFLSTALTCYAQHNVHGIIAIDQPRNVLTRANNLRETTIFQIEPNDSDEVRLQNARTLFIDTITDALQRGTPLSSTALDRLASCGIEHFARDVRSDVDGEGQLTLANQSTYFSTWGQHYMYSWIRAHQLEMCLNFRDPSMQKYGGPMFQRVRTAVETLFISLPPPEPTRSQHHYYGQQQQQQQPIAMSNYYDQTGSCFGGNCLVNMADGRSKRVRDLQQGDVLSNGSIVRCLIQTVSTFDVIRFDRGTTDELVITAWHPIRRSSDCRDGGDNEDGGNNWQFPIYAEGGQQHRVLEVFNLLLQGEHHFVTIGKRDVVTLGHGYLDNEVVRHAYFGTERVVEDLAKIDGFHEGRIVITNFCFQKNKETGHAEKLIAYVSC